MIPLSGARGRTNLQMLKESEKGTMKRIGNILKIGLVIAVLGAGLQACPQKSSPQKVVTEKKSFSKDELQKRYERLELRYHVLQKDDPPQQHTLELRNWMVDAKEALKKGDLEKAAAMLDKSEEWMGNAESRYYRAHKEQIVSGASDETGKEIMSEALEHLDRAKKAERDNESWAAEQYYRAAMEHGELAVLAASQSPGDVTELIDIYPSMRKIYNEAGATERAEKTRKEVISHIHSILRQKEQAISNRLSGKTQGYGQASLSRNKDTFDEKAKKVRELHEEYLELASAAQSGFPEARFQPVDYSKYIAKWIDDWHGFFQGAPPPKETPDKESKSQKLKKKLVEHNKIKEGAKSIEGSDIVLEELSIYTYEGAIFIKGKIQNKRSQPIYEPRVVVTGNLMSEVVNIGYYKMSPIFSSTFRVALKHYTQEAFIQNNKVLPSHELMIIFKDEPNGPDKKLIKKIK